jgi:hypothetical protein
MRLVLLFLMAVLAMSQDNFVAGAGGISTLSADARVVGSPPESISAYKPENGPTFSLSGGRHLSEHFSVQLSYGWNRNRVLLSGNEIFSQSSYELPLRISAHTMVGEAMAYFRRRDSRLRPYLSAGPGVAYTNAKQTGALLVRNSPQRPSAGFNSTQPAFRVAVGIDYKVGGRFSLRYSFSETIQRNPIAAALRPPGKRGLANFQNWWGAVWSF